VKIGGNDSEATFCVGQIPHFCTQLCLNLFKPGGQLIKARRVVKSDDYCRPAYRSYTKKNIDSTRDTHYGSMNHDYLQILN